MEPGYRKVIGKTGELTVNRSVDSEGLKRHDEEPATTVRSCRVRLYSSNRREGVFSETGLPVWPILDGSPP